MVEHPQICDAAHLYMGLIRNKYDYRSSLYNTGSKSLLEKIGRKC